MLEHRFRDSGAFTGSSVADFFAGSGAMGLECLSRGAAECLFVERDRRSFVTLRENIRTLGCQEQANAVCANAWTMRIPRPASGGRYLVAFVDPPYRDAGHAVRVCGLLERLAARIDPGGVIVFRREVGTPLAVEQLRALRVDEERVWGRMLVTFLVPFADRAPKAAEAD